MSNFILGFKFALSYFTILPVSFKEGVDLSTKEVLDKLVFSMPFVGLLLGSLTLLLYSFLDSLPWLGAVISACFYMVLYGFLHTEAIADIADAIYAKHSGKDAYEVIKEPTIGAMGLLYTSIFLILKIAAIVFLFINNLLLEFLAVVIISRICIQFVIYTSEFRSFFLTKLNESFQTKSFLISITIFSIFIVFILGFKFLWFILAGFVLAFLIAKFIKKSVGFLNGDALGTILEALEILLCIMVCYLWF